MFRKLSLFVVVPVLLITLPALAQIGSTSVADEVIAVTKAQWAAEIKKDMAGALRNIADEYTEFNPEFPTRLDGKSLSQRFAEARMGGTSELIAGDMTNEKVQVYDNVAILTYNFAGLEKDKDGAVESVKAKSTRVYVKRGGNWMLVHANFAPVD